MNQTKRKSFWYITQNNTVGNMQTKKPRLVSAYQKIGNYYESGKDAYFDLEMGKRYPRPIIRKGWSKRKSSVVTTSAHTGDIATHYMASLSYIFNNEKELRYVVDAINTKIAALKEQDLINPILESTGERLTEMLENIQAHN